MNKKVFLKNLIYPTITFCVILIIWSISAKVVNSKFILPNFLDTIKGTFNLFKDNIFWKSFLLTLLRTFLSFSISFVMAFVLAILSTINIVIKKLFSPIIMVSRALPTMSVVLLLLLWTTPTTATIIVALLVVFPTLYAGIYSALLSIDSEILEMCKVYNIEKKVIILKIYIPQILPLIFGIIGSSLSLNLKLMVAAEVLAHTKDSIGGLMQEASSYFETAKLLGLTLVVIFSGIVLESAFNIISKKFSRWK